MAPSGLARIGGLVEYASRPVLGPTDERRVGHPVTIGHTRVNTINPCGGSDAKEGQGQGRV